jgi:hypothetical protein
MIHYFFNFYSFGGKEQTRCDKVYSFLQFSLPQHVSGTNMPIIRSTISEYLALLGDHTWKGYAK